jgi:hypothetical protein
MLSCALYDRLHAPEIGIPPPPAGIVCVTDYISVVRRFAAKLTLQCHSSSYLAAMGSRKFASTVTKLSISSYQTRKAQQSVPFLFVVCPFPVCRFYLQPNQSAHLEVVLSGDSGQCCSPDLHP